MSENSVLNFGTESFQMSHFQTAPPTAPQKPTAYEDANKIFELINQLNSTIGFETKQTQQQQQQQQSSVKDYEIRDSIEPLEMTPNGNNSTTTAASTVPTSKIPRINFLHNKPPPTPAPPTTITTATAPVQQPVNVPTKIPTYQTQAAPTTVNSNPSPAPTTPTVGSKLQAPMSLKEILNNGTSSQSTTRLPRSQVRNSIAASTPPPTAEGDDEEAERAAAASAAAARIRSVTKRGVSLSNVPKMKTTRSMSINDAADSLDDTASQVSSEGKKNIKYVVRHKPRESQVKIFTQKVEIKNVSSKIGSLEKAAHYTPSGGNIKIESHKLAWNAKSRIGSLEYADYRPKGGNVKIESHKLNFREKAKPKTDTGLICVEEYINQSLNNSNEDLNKSQLSYTGSN